MAELVELSHLRDYKVLDISEHRAIIAAVQMPL